MTWKQLPLMLVILGHLFSLTLKNRLRGHWKITLITGEGYTRKALALGLGCTIYKKKTECHLLVRSRYFFYLYVLITEKRCRNFTWSNA